MRDLETTPTDWAELTEEERAIVLREHKALSAEFEYSELDTGRRILLVRDILQKYQRFSAFLYDSGLPLTGRTGYRRMRTYERATEIWPQEVIDAAIKRRLKVIGITPEKLMGLYEDVPAPPKSLTPQKVEKFLDSAELFVRRSSLQRSTKALQAYPALKQCFRFVERATQSLSSKERPQFLKDLVGLEMALFGVDEPRGFAPTKIPPNFWTSQLGYARSSETRARISKAATERWERVRRAQNTAKKQD
jgi:hypothetical protein